MVRAGRVDDRLSISQHRVGAMACARESGATSSGSSDSDSSLSSSTTSSDTSACAAKPEVEEGLKEDLVPENCESDVELGNSALDESTVAARVFYKSGWPLGPDSLSELFTWPTWNAQKLLSNPQARDIFTGIKEIVINDAYSGMGTGSLVFHWQAEAFCSHFAVVSKLDSCP